MCTKNLYEARPRRESQHISLLHPISLIFTGEA